MRRRNRSNERGSALVEAAIATPLVFLLIFGVIEFGLAMKDYVAMSSGVRAGAREASVQGRNADADWQILKAVKRATPGLDNNQIVRVVVFKATGPGMAVPTSCKTVSVAGSCNSYGTADLARPAGDFTGSGVAPDRFWPPSNRKSALHDPPDYIGVWVEVHHDGLTQFVNMTDDYDDQIVMRIEPESL